MSDYARLEADIRKRVRDIRRFHDGKDVHDATEHILNDADELAALVAGFVFRDREALQSQVSAVWEINHSSPCQQQLDRMTAYAMTLESALNATSKDGARSAIATLRREHGVQVLMGQAT